MASPINETAASSSSSSLPLSSADHQNHYKYEVFLSFRGDTRYDFTDHLYKALRDRGIETFRDAEKLRIGEEISPALLKAIEESRVSIVVFSENYASSWWCLEELVKILDCRKSKGQVVKPVFYKVDPSHVRHQIRAFGGAFDKLCGNGGRYEKSRGKWKKALKEAADLLGWQLEDKEYETEFIKRIVEELSPQLNLSCDWHVAEHPIGVESSRQDVVDRLLKAEEDSVRMVAIWGPGGIGKTTIANAVFNSIRRKFDGCCFLEEVRSNSSSNGLAKLQETLLFKILRESNLKVSSVDEGVGIIKARMREKKVLLVLDDLSHSEQLKKLVPSLDCFGPGSRILITTRDKGWLTGRVDGDAVYEVQMLGDDQALKLFSLHAFQSNEPLVDYLELARRAVHYAKGLPLALMVLGSHLFRRSREEWEATLDCCKGEDPYGEIRNILKISYDALEGDLQGYFLDIACFFKGELVDDVKPILEACYNLKSVIGIKRLQEKALIRIDHGTFNGGFIWMHDLIEEMGKDIVYKESPDEPGKRSRVWSEDVAHILTNNTGTDKVIGIQVSRRSSTISLNAKSFSGMTKLRYISIGRMMKYESFSRDIDYLSDQLRWLDWPECPLLSFPSDFHPNRLVNLNIPGSCRITLTRLLEGRKKFSRLTFMNLSGRTSLKELSDFSGFPNLRGLSLRGTGIRELDESIGNLIGLEYLNLTECKNLTTLPCSIYGLQNLGFLDLGECSKLVRFPTNTKILNVDSCSLSLPKLRVFSIAGCRLSDCDFLMILNCWETLEWLNLSRNNFVSLPACLTKFVKLEELDLGHCKRLRKIPELPPNVEPHSWGCESLDREAWLSDEDDCESLYREAWLSDEDDCESLEERFSTLTNCGCLPKLQNQHWLSCFGFLSLRNWLSCFGVLSNRPISPMIYDLQSDMRHWLPQLSSENHRQQEQQEHPICPQLPSLNSSAASTP